MPPTDKALPPDYTDGQRNPSKPSPAVKAPENQASVVLGDSANATKCVKSVFGPNAKPDWHALLRLGRSLGNPVHGIIVANDGLPERFIRRFRAMGYAVQFSHAWDVDDRVVAQAVRMIDRARVFVIVSGDGGFCSLVSVLRRLSKYVIVVAVESCCHPNLRAVADQFVPMPVAILPPRPEPSSAAGPRNSKLGILANGSSRVVAARRTRCQV